MSPKWSRHTLTFDEDSVRFLSIVQYFLGQWFGNSEAAAEQAMDEFMADTSWDEDMYHHEGAYRTAALIHYLRILGGERCDWLEWLQKHGHNPTPEEARKYFWDHYLTSTTKDREPS